MNDFGVFAVLTAFCACSALAAPAGPPMVSILKQVNRQNEDGSYSYGYENADGTYKIETKYPTGEVFGKYGYVDETGKLRTVEYGASARGFEPVGTDITVPPPSLVGESNDLHRDGQQSADNYDDGQYHEDPSVYYMTGKQLVKQQQQQQQWSAGGNQPSLKARSSDSRPFQTHPSVRDFDPATGSFSISYSD